MLPTASHCIKRKLFALMGLTLCIIVIHGEEPEMSEEIDVPPIPIWTPTVTVTTGGGYKDNLLLSHVAWNRAPS